MASQPVDKMHESNPSAVHEIPKKRIVICCDGTWQDADSANTPPSNVAEIVRAIPPVGKDYKTGKAITQVVFYQNGVGTGSAGWYQKYIGSQISGATGGGLVFNIREAYAFLCSNYYDGDEIVLIGFSRGAFTARSLSTLIGEVGLLTPKGLAYLVQIVDDWEYQLRPERPREVIDIWKDRPKFGEDHERYMMELKMHQLTRLDIKVKAVAVWDTVGSLGVPASSISLWFHRVFSNICPQFIADRLPKPRPKDFAFVNTKVGSHIEYAFHALGLDEKRESFTPTIWHKPDPEKWPKVLKQTWFPGVHSDIGGSYANNDNSILTLAWIMGQLETHHILYFNEQHVFRLMQRCVRDHLREDSAWDTRVEHDHNASGIQRSETFGALTPWGTGKIHNSYTGFMRLGGVVHRTPMEYKEVTSTTKQGPMGTTHFKLNIKDRLTNTEERMHASVRERLHAAEAADASNDVKSLDPWLIRTTVLKDWVDGENADGVWSYVKKVKDEDGCEETLEILEDELTGFELRVKETWDMVDMHENLAKINASGAQDSTGKVLDFARVDEIGTPADIQHHHIWRSQTFLDSEGNPQEFTPDEEHDHGHNHESQTRDFAAQSRPAVVG